MYALGEDKLAIRCVGDDIFHRCCYSITQVRFCGVNCMRSNDDILVNYLIELVCDCVGSIFVRSTETDKIPLENAICARQPIKTSVENSCNFAHMVLIDFFMRFVDFDLYFVEDRFGANEEVSGGRISPPNDSGSAINFGGKINLRLDRLQERSITCEDGIFGVFDVKVLSHD